MCINIVDMDQEYYKNAQEIWKDITGYEGLYQVSDFGRVKSFNLKFNINKRLKVIQLNNNKLSYAEIARQTGISEGFVNNMIKSPGRYLNTNGKILKPGKYDRYGHLNVNLWKNGNKQFFAVHLLVMEAFVGPRPEGMEICHNDGNPGNNRKDNLRYDTPKNNNKDKIKHGTLPCGEKCSWSKVNNQQALEIKKLAKEGKFTQTQIGKMFNIAPSTVSNIKTGKHWKNLDE